MYELGRKDFSEAQMEACFYFIAENPESTWLTKEKFAKGVPKLYACQFRPPNFQEPKEVKGTRLQHRINQLQGKSSENIPSLPAKPELSSDVKEKLLQKRQQEQAKGITAPPILPKPDPKRDKPISEAQILKEKARIDERQMELRLQKMAVSAQDPALASIGKMLAKANGDSPKASRAELS